MCARGERRSGGEGAVAGMGECWGGSPGDERVRSSESVSGNGRGDVRSRLSTTFGLAFIVCGRASVAAVAACGWPSVRSRLSILGAGAFVLLSRGEVRRVRVVDFVIAFSPVDDFEDEEERDALDEMDVSGGRVCVVGAYDIALSGDDSVKSRVSTRSGERRNCDGVGIGASSKMLVVSRNFVGVWDALHVSSVVCLPFPGEAVTDSPWFAFIVRVLAFLVRAGDCAG